MRADVADVVQRCGALADTASLVVGVSGGPDSLALLHLLANSVLSADRVVAAHLNHRLRPSAAAEADYVAEICREWRISCYVGERDVASLAQDQQLSLEEAARQARYQYLAEVAVAVGMSVVAVGHHADDQAETVLMHFLRGSGLAGLRGMLPSASVPNAPQIVLLRPLLQVERATILAYCARHGLQPALDESNLDTAIYRNRLRHELLPLLESYNPNIRQRLQHTAAVLAADYDLLATLQDEAWEQLLLTSGAGWLHLDLPAWQDLPLSLRRSIIRLAAWRLRSTLRDVGFQAVEGARRVLERGAIGSQAVLTGGLRVTVGYDGWTMSVPEAQMPLPDLPLVVREGMLPVPGRFQLAGAWELTAEFVELDAPEIITANQDRWTAFLPTDIPARLSVRTRRAGERFRPLGMGGHSTSIREYMINGKLPADLRKRWPIVAVGEQPAWLVGYRLDDRVRCEPGSLEAIRLTCRRFTSD